MDLRQGSKSLSCETLLAGLSFMDQQKQPRGGPPPLEVGKHLFTSDLLFVFFCISKGVWNI